jgi:hypothetical protein
MKINRIKTLARLCGMTFAAALLFGTIGALSASEIPTAKGGATKLMELTGRVVTKAEPSNYKPMSCAKCTDRVVEVKDNLPTKGAGARALLAGGVPTKRVSTHECEGCGNTWVVSGHGKAKTSTAVHTCTSCGAESLACCSTSKSGITATKGMEKKFEVAPVK